MSLTIESGNIHGILGQMEPVKTTLFEIIYGLSAPAAGEVSVYGKHNYKKCIGYLETVEHLISYLGRAEKDIWRVI